MLDWKREITELALKKPPLLSQEEAALIEEALKDETRTRFFTDVASSPEWIDWLDNRKHLDALFRSGNPSTPHVILVWWLANRFALSCADKLFLLIVRHETRLNPFFWHVLGQKIGLGEQGPVDKGVLSRWISLLLATHPPVAYCRVSSVLFWMGEKSLKHGMLDCLLQVYNVMVGNRLQLKQDIWGSSVDDDDSTTPVDVDLVPIGEQYHLEVLWRNGLKPNLAQVAEPLLRRLVGCLEERHLTFSIWQKANRSRDSDNWRRSAIEDGVEDEAVDILINAARDCLEWLAKNQAGTAKHWCAQLVGSQAPLLRRLAVYALSARADLTADDKIDWLLECIGLHDFAAHHEIFQAVRLTYPESSLERRKAIIGAVRAYRWPDKDDLRQGTTRGLSSFGMAALAP